MGALTDLRLDMTSHIAIIAVDSHVQEPKPEWVKLTRQNMEAGYSLHRAIAK